MDDFKFQLGIVARDVVSGFEGFVVVRAQYFRSDNRYGLCSRELHDEKPIDLEWFDEGRLEIIDAQGIV